MHTHTHRWGGDAAPSARGPTCQVEVLQRSLGSHRGVQLRAEAGGAVIRTVDLPFGRSDVVCVCDGSSRVHVLDLQRPQRKESVESGWRRSSAPQRHRRYLLSGDLGENVHDHLHNVVDEGLLQLLVLGSSVGHFAVLPLLKPRVVGEGDQTQGGLS